MVGLEDERMLVPLPDYEPRLVGRKNDHAAQFALQWGLMAHMRDRAAEIEESGSFALTQHEWGRLCREAGLPRPLDARVFEEWTSGADPLIREVRPGEFVPAESYELVTRTLREAGKKERDGRRAAGRRWRPKEARRVLSPV